MPLTSKGTEILHAMQKQYGEKKGEQVFYASRNAGKITGVDDWEGDASPSEWMADDDHHATIDACAYRMDILSQRMARLDRSPRKRMKA